jgi:hypothetical protein
VIAAGGDQHGDRSRRQRAVLVQQAKDNGVVENHRLMVVRRYRLDERGARPAGGGLARAGPGPGSKARAPARLRAKSEERDSTSLLEDAPSGAKFGERRVKLRAVAGHRSAGATASADPAERARIAAALGL